MENINVISIIGKKYTCQINFREVVSFLHNYNENTVTCVFKALASDNSYITYTYKDVIEVNYLET